MTEPQTAPATILDWLARSGYGVEFWNADPATPAPFTRLALAEAYHRVDPSCTVEEWDYVLANETGAVFA